MHGSSYGNVFNSMDVTNCDMNGAVIIPECKTIKGKGITSGGTLNTFNFINIRGVLVVCSQRAVSVQSACSTVYICAGTHAYTCPYTCLDTFLYHCLNVCTGSRQGVPGSSPKLYLNGTAQSSNTECLAVSHVIRP